MFVSIWILKSDTLQVVFLWKQEICHVLVVHTNLIFGFSNSLLLSCLKVLNPENLSWENYLLVFTKSVNSNFRAFLLVPLTQNILGYSLFGTGINMASCFAIVFQWQVNQLHQQKPCKQQNLVCWCLLVGLENYFLIEFATKFIVKMYSIKLFP